MNDFPPSLKAVLVDFDGTLVDSMPALRECYRSFLEYYGIESCEKDFRSLIGPSLLEIVENLRLKYSLPGSSESLYGHYSDLVRNAYANKISLFPGALEVLQETKRRGIKIAIVTSASLSLLETFLSRFELLNFFDALIAGIDHEASKPSPAIYLRALKTLGVSEKEAIAVEDSTNGIASAEAAGLYVIPFDAGYSTEWVRCEKNGKSIKEMLNGYQTFKIHPSFQVRVVDSREELMLSDVEESAVEALWNRAQKKYEGRLFNGKMLAYSHLDEDRLYGYFVDYKYYIAQLGDSALKERLRIRPVAISCLCTWEEKVLIGKRSLTVTDYPGYFETVPSGGIDPKPVKQGVVNYIEQALTELEEEAGIGSRDVADCHPLLIYQDLRSDSFEVCLHIVLKKESPGIEEGENNEYSRLEWMSLERLNELVTRGKKSFVPLSLHLISLFKEKELTAGS